MMSGGVAPPRSETTARRPTNIRAGGLLDRSDIEAAILRFDAAVEEATDTYAALCDASAAAEADWKQALMTALVRVDADVDTRPGDAKTREAKAMIAARSTATAVEVTGDPDARDLFRSHLIMDRRMAAAKQAVQTLMSRLDAYRTLAASARSQS